MQRLRSRRLPHDIQSILAEFNNRRPCFRDIAEEVLMDFRARCKAGEIAKVAVYAMMDSILTCRGLKLRVLCTPDDRWRCLLYSDDESVGYPFFSGPETIVEDIMRILNQ